MTELLAQHGAAKGQKITDSIISGNLKGAIFSPNDEKIDSIVTYVEKTEGLNFENTFLDPQFYFSTFEPTVLKNLVTYLYTHLILLAVIGEKRTPIFLIISICILKIRNYFQIL